MAFAQLTYRESLRDVEVCLRSMQQKLYHLGIRGKVSRSTLADANESRDWRIYADFAQVLIQQAHELYAKEPFGTELDETTYALDSSTIDLCLSLFPWAHFRKRKAAVKLHTLLNLRGNIPSFIKITDGTVHDVNILDDLIPEPGSFYIMDRGYIDFQRLYVLKQESAFFVTRAKDNMQFERIYSHPVDKSTGLRCDQTIKLTGNITSKYYPEHLRRVKYFDEKNKKTLAFLSNNFSLPAIQIAQLYKCRWQVELFFKWIKQHLRIKSFYGTSENAVKTQIWIAISVYVVVAIARKRLKIENSLYTLLQFLSLNLFEKTLINQALSKNIEIFENTDIQYELNFESHCVGH
jgi:transposase